MNPIQKKCVDYARTLDYMPHKMDTSQEAGWPDYMFVGYNGVILFVEFKRPGEPLRPAQDRMIKKMAMRGHTVFVIDNTDAFDRLMLISKGGILDEQAV